MRDGKNTEVVKADTFVTCSDCGAEPAVGDPWRWARKHAEKTGHIPTVLVTYDVFKKGWEG